MMRHFLPNHPITSSSSQKIYLTHLGEENKTGFLFVRLKRNGGSTLKVVFSSYTTTTKPLKEKLKSKEDAEIVRFEMRGDIWARRRMCLRDNPGFHLLQWRKTSGLKRAQMRQQEEVSSQDNNSNRLLEQVQLTMKNLVEELKINTRAVTESSQAIAKSCQDVVEACKLTAASTSTGAGVVN
ncbi:hypothetical protein ACQJBY_052852 [Aegilops geniculata]